MSVYEKIPGLLEDLGDDPAQALRELGIKGVKGDAQSCPVAKYIKQHVDGCVHVDGFNVAAGPNSHIWFDYANPGPVEQFVADFDLGLHPELEA